MCRRNFYLWWYATFPGVSLCSCTSWRNVHRLIIFLWDFPQSHTFNSEHIPQYDSYVPVFVVSPNWRNPCISTRDFLALLRYTVVSTLETCANLVVSQCDTPNKYGLTSTPCRTTQRKYFRHYAVTRIHFYPMYYPCSTSILHKWIIPLRTSPCVCLSFPTLKSGLAPKCGSQRIPVSCSADCSVLTSATKQQQKNFDSRFPTISVSLVCDSTRKVNTQGLT